MSKETTEALRFIMAFYEPGQTYLDTNAWKQAEAQARAALAEAEAPTDAQSASKSVQKRLSVQTGGEAPTVAQPVAWVSPRRYGSAVTFAKPQKPAEGDCEDGAWYCTPLYTAIPQPAPLTDEQINAIALTPGDYRTFARAIERAHGIRSKS